jgi:hypothetical protein
MEVRSPEARWSASTLVPRRSSTLVVTLVSAKVAVSTEGSRMKAAMIDLPGFRRTRIEQASEKELVDASDDRGCWLWCLPHKGSVMNLWINFAHKQYGEKFAV